jgi:gamma-glutamyltranspeptidase/glutathione hydrolase
MKHRSGIVAAGHTATAEAGAAILRQGGNAVDAAIAAVCTSFTAEPVLTAAGGGGFMLVADSNNQSILFDGFARMPSGLALMPELEIELKAIPIDFGNTVQTFHIGQASVGTPSLLAMLFAAHKQLGRLPLREALAPGIDAARNGIRLNHLQASFIKLLRPILTDTSGASSLYAPDGQGRKSGVLLSEGENFCNPDLANTLEMLSIEGIAEMYHGDLAKAIVTACIPHGLLSMDDMRAKQVHIRSPLQVNCMGGRLLTNPAPSSGGLLIAFAAAVFDKLMEMDDAKQLPWPVLMAECLRSASNKRRSGLDSRIYEPDIADQELTSGQFESAVQAIGLRLSGLTDAPHPESSNRHGSTTHISIMDKDGMAVSLTTSNGEGSGIVVPGTGIHLNNMLGEEDINPLGFHTLDPGTTLSSMMAPSIFLTDGRPSMVLGSGGSNRLRGAILQTLVRHKHLGQDIETAVHAPRLHNEGNELEIEPDFISEYERMQLMKLGWKLKDWQQQSVYFGGVHAISRDERGNIQAAADPRRGGAVAWA